MTEPCLCHVAAGAFHPLLYLQRLNGRMAMLGFAGIALAELKEQTPAGEQLAGDVFGVLLLSITFTLASLFPKFSTGRPLKVSTGVCVRFELM